MTTERHELKDNPLYANREMRTLEEARQEAQAERSAENRTAPTVTGNTPQQKFANFRNTLNAGLIERHVEVDIVLCGLILREHPLLVGVPGTAKSMLCDSLTDWIDGEAFSILLSRFTTPEEMFGPVSVTGLKNDDYRRIVDGFFPTADVAFLDEIFKASSAILNTTLKGLNERVYRNGNQEIRIPLQIALAASNEWPTEQNELAALFDRFLLRRKVETVRSTKGLERLLWEPDLGPKLTERITIPEVEQARAEADALPYTPEAKEAAHTIIARVRDEGIFPGDRRLRKSIRAAKAFAYLNGSPAVSKEDLDILSHCLWEDPTGQPMKVAQIVGKVANPAGMRCNELMAQIEAAVKNLVTNDMTAMTTAHKKLQDIRAELEKVKGNGNVSHAMAHCDEEMTRIKVAIASTL
jgi:MoxR-like ATPase